MGAEMLKDWQVQMKMLRSTSTLRAIYPRYPGRGPSAKPRLGGVKVISDAVLL
jgi:hypothetical protein